MNDETPIQETDSLPPVNEGTGNDNSESDKNNGMPTGIKILIAGLFIFLIICIVAAGLFFKYKSSKKAVDTEISAVKNILPAKILAHVKANQDDYLISNNDNAPNNIPVQRIDAVSKEDIVKLIDNALKAPEKNIAVLKKQISVLSSKSIKLNDAKPVITDSDIRDIIEKQFAESDISYSSGIASLENKFKLLSRYIDENTSLIDELKTKNQSKNQPAFTLLSVDEWGSSKQAALELDGYIALASLGDVKAGWRITDIQNNFIKCERLEDGLKFDLYRKGSQ